MNELQLVEQKDLREHYIDRIEILDKVKALLLLPDINLATTEQVANFYEVSQQAITSALFDHKDELNSDGYVVWKTNDFRSSQKEFLKINGRQGGFTVEFTNGFKLNSTNKGIGLFTRRAILRIGMLLRDSKIAKEVRTQLLNIEEKTTVDIKLKSINEEKLLALDVLYANDENNRLMAFCKFNDYKNKHINLLENKIESLTTGTLTWDTRESINRMSRKIAAKIFDGNYSKAWDKIYAEMLYKYNIGVVARKKSSKVNKPTIFDVLNEEEIKLLVKTCLSLCEMYKIDIDDLIMKK